MTQCELTLSTPAPETSLHQPSHTTRLYSQPDTSQYHITLLIQDTTAENVSLLHWKYMSINHVEHFLLLHLYMQSQLFNDIFGLFCNCPSQSTLETCKKQGVALPLEPVSIYNLPRRKTEPWQIYNTKDSSVRNNFGSPNQVQFLQRICKCFFQWKRWGKRKYWAECIFWKSRSQRPIFPLRPN